MSNKGHERNTRPVRSKRERPGVVIIGAGFGGLNAAMALSRRGVSQWADIRVVDSRDYHLFTPLLYEAAAGAIQASRLRYPLVPVLSRLGVKFVQGRAEGVDTAARQVMVEGRPLSYDYLVIAGGSQANYYGHNDFAAYTLPLKTDRDAERLFEHVSSCLDLAAGGADDQQRNRLLTFVIVGAGPTGVELAAALQQTVGQRLERSRRGSSWAGGIILVEARAGILRGMPDRLARAAAAELSSAGITILAGSPVEAVSPEGVTIRGRSMLPAATVIWTAGICPVPLPGVGDQGTASDGRLLVDSTLRLTGLHEVFAVGDIAAAPHEAGYAPANAPAAIQMGKAASRNVTRLLLGLGPVEFRYHHEGDLVALGHQSAVAMIGDHLYTGYPAWAMRRAVYLANLMGMKNRIGLATDWWRSGRRAQKG